MAIYFADKDYLENFMNYIGERDTGFNCCGFSKSDSLKEFSKKNEIAVLLTDLSGFEGEAKYGNIKSSNKIRENLQEDSCHRELP